MTVSLRKRIGFKVNVLKARALERLLGPRALGIVWDSWNGLLCLRPTDMVIAKTLSTTGAWDREQISYLLTLVGPESRVLIVGAHVGSVAIPIAKRVSNVVAYEANPRNFALLELNLRLNGIGNCTVRNRAAGDTSRQIEFLSNTVNTGASKIVPKKITHAFSYDSPATIRVEMVALDEDLDRFDFDLVVMDIEGAEYYALKGMRKVLEESRLLQIEYLPQLVDNVAGVSDADFLDPLGRSFSSARVLKTSETYARAEFPAMIRKLRTTAGGDILFSRP